MARLGDLCRFINGDRGKNYPSQAEISSDGDIPFINAGHLVDGNLDFSDMNYISEEKYNQLNSGKIQENDVLYCLRGSLGKKAIIKGISKGAIASSLVIIRPNARLINSDYLFYALESPTVQEQMMQANNGSSQPNLSAKSVSDYTFNLPTINEQCEIVSKLAKVNDLISLRKGQLAKLDELVKARFVELFGDPVSNPLGWEKKSLKEVCIKLNDGTHFSPESFETGEYKYVTAKNIKMSGFDFTNITYVPEEVHRPIYERCNPELGDVLYIKDGVTTGIAMVNTLDEEFTLLSSVALLKQDRRIMNGYFLTALLNNENMYADIRSNMGGAAITRLTIAKLNGIQVILPPIELQNQFATFVEQTDKSKLAIQQSLDKLETLKKALMQKYFG